MKALLIAEKPDLMRDIKRVYQRMSHPDEITFMSLIGHVVELKSPEEYREDWGRPWRLEVLPMIPEQFEYVVKPNARDVFQRLKKELHSGKYDYVINACDAGREGELIFHAFYQVAGGKLPVKRLWASDTTEETLKEALLNLIDDNEPALTRLKASSRYRAYFDWLLGMNLSRAISLKTKKLIPIGRVMTPTLGIVVKRELEIQNFQPKDYWQLEADFGDYKGIWFDEKTGENKFWEKEKAKEYMDRLSKHKQGTVVSVGKERKKQHAPTLHSLLELQKETNKVYGYSAQKTLDIAQSLYEKRKLITYPRTESRYLPKNLAGKLPDHLKALEEIEEIRPYVQAILANKKRMDEIMNSKKYVDDKKVTDHHAIIPTTTKPVLSALTEEERNVYMLIVKRLLSIFMDPYVTDKTTVITKVDNESFKTVGNTVVDLGYMELYKKQEEAKEEETTIPSVTEGQQVPLVKLRWITKQTTPPSRYDDSSLLQAMANAGSFVEDEELRNVLREKAGLGTSATRAGIIEKLLDYKMIGRKGKSFYATQFGIEIIRILEGREIVSPELTAKWEMKLSQIEEGVYSHEDFYQEMIQYTKEVTKDFMENIHQTISSSTEESVVGNCPKCKSPVIEGKSYYLCKQYKQTCDFLIPKEFGGAKISKTEAKKLLSGKETKELSFTWKNGAKSKGKLILDQEGKLSFSPKNSSQEKKSVGTCPKCSSSVIEGKEYYLCENYKKTCDFILKKEIHGAKLKASDIKRLLKGEETREMEFTWKNGNKGKAKLIYKDGKLEFVFGGRK